MSNSFLQNDSDKDTNYFVKTFTLPQACLRIMKIKAF